MAGRDGTTVVVGYDRPLGEFFAQVWRSLDDDEPIVSVECFDPDDLGEAVAEIPEGLREALIAEAAGEADTNTVKDWR